MPVARHAFEDGERHSVEGAARSLSCPVLVIHGDADEAVPVQAQDDIASWVPASEVLRLPGAGHTFGAVHPFAGPTPDLGWAVCCSFGTVHVSALLHPS